MITTPATETPATTTRVLFLHAYPLNAAMWDGVRAELPDHWQSEAFSYQGFGGTQAPAGEPRLTPFVEQVIGWLEEHGPAVLVGLSLGGYVMGQVARWRPELLRGVVFCDTRLTPDGPEERERRETNARRIETEGIDFLLREYLPNCIGTTTSDTRPDVVSRAAELITQSNPEGLAWGMRAMATRTDTREAVRRADVPGHVIVGEEDLLCNAQDRADLQEATGGGMTVINGVGHYSALESPPEFARALVRAVEGWEL
ncbi:alpha/beta hydrolase [Lysinibacter sp. HNR]|uniref:alpha/beta fold hydrolase n=1 Tax=Lysinibacter sp. HNR TaxID=3031408 RepID=UPI002434CCB3|nr:alpha/beta hydrolase [Lysinibacter sp. HNR]WGD36970.1 alpha/beta hydrolase [Lysinibacter sp. HNR]